MMLAYVNIFKPLVSKIPLSDIKLDFDFNGWMEGKTRISINDVLKNKKSTSLITRELKMLICDTPL